MNVGKYPMSSLDVVKKLAAYLTHYFTENRKEMCFDLSGPLHPLRHYPFRSQKTLIDYQQDVSKPLKYYFSPLDLRKRLTGFHQDIVNEERHKKILQKIEEYILCITTNKYTHRTINERRRPPWDSYWWKGTSVTFQSLMFMSLYGGCRNKRNFYNKYSDSLSKGVDRRRSQKGKTKMRRNYGAPPILKMCPNPYASRGEAERIINHAARLLLVTENYDPNAYEHTAPGMKIRQLVKVRTLKSSTKSRSVRKSESTTEKLPVKEKQSLDSTSTSGAKTNAFKIKKTLQGKEYISENENSEHGKFSHESINNDLIKRKISNDSLSSLEIIEIEGDSDFDQTRNHNEKSKEKHKRTSFFPNCMCKKSVSIEPSTRKSTKKYKTNLSDRPIIKKDIYPEKSTENNKPDNKYIKPSEHNLQKSLGDNSKYPASSITLDNSAPIEKHSSRVSRDSKKDKTISDYNKLNSESYEESAPILVEGTHKSNVVGWLKNSQEDEKTLQENQSCNEKILLPKNVKQIFEVKIITGDRIGASTNAAVWLHIAGDKASLKHSVELKVSSTHRRPFYRGHTDLFKIKSSKYLGIIQSIQIGHDSDQPGSDWFLESVSIRDCNQQVSYFFPCSKWLSVRSDDKQTRVNILSQPKMHEASIYKSTITHSDAAIQCDDNIEENNNLKKPPHIHHREKEKSGMNKSDSLSDLAVEFSELSFSESSASSLMSVRRHYRHSNSDIFQLHNLEDVAEEAVISVRENISNLPLDFNFSDEINDNTDGSLNENAEDSYSPNPISFCDEETA